jgi:uncharacterized protein (DUF2252 family)
MRGVLPVLLGLGCAAAPDGDPRSARLRDELTQENSRWLLDRGDALALKYQRMAADPYDFLRGTAGWFFAEASRPEAERPEVSLLSYGDVDATTLVGDPHLENLGTVLHGEGPGPTEAGVATLSLEWVDLDGLSFGPWIWDVRRAALAIAAASGRDPTCNEPCRERTVRAFAGAFVAEVQRRDQGGGPWDRASELDAASRALVAEADEEGAARKRHGKWLDPDDPSRFAVSPELDDDGRGLLPTTTQERELVRDVLAGCEPPMPAGFRILDVADWRGSGVASLPALRFLVLWDRGQPGPEDDDIFDVREVVDPPVIPGFEEPVPGLFGHVAERVVAGARLIGSSGDADVRIAAGRGEGMDFRVRSQGSWFQEFDRDVLLGLDTDDPVRLGFGETVGRVLGAAAAQAVTTTLEPALPLLADALRGNDAAFADEVVAFAEFDRKELLEDHRRFVTMLAADPLLGGVLGTDTP